MNKIYNQFDNFLNQDNCPYFVLGKDKKVMKSWFKNRTRNNYTPFRFSDRKNLIHIDKNPTERTHLLSYRLSCHMYKYKLFYILLAVLIGAITSITPYLFVSIVLGFGDVSMFISIILGVALGCLIVFWLIEKVDNFYTDGVNGPQYSFEYKPTQQAYEKYNLHNIPFLCVGRVSDDPDTIDKERSVRQLTGDRAEIMSDIDDLLSYEDEILKELDFTKLENTYNSYVFLLGFVLNYRNSISDELKNKYDLDLQDKEDNMFNLCEQLKSEAVKINEETRKKKEKSKASKQKFLDAQAQRIIPTNH